MTYLNVAIGIALGLMIGFSLSIVLCVAMLSIATPFILPSLDYFDDRSGAVAAVQFKRRAKQKVRVGMHGNEVIAFAEQMEREYSGFPWPTSRGRGAVWHSDERSKGHIVIRGHFWPPWGWTVFATVSVDLNEQQRVTRVHTDVVRDGT